MSIVFTVSINIRYTAAVELFCVYESYVFTVVCIVKAHYNRITRMCRACKHCVQFIADCLSLSLFGPRGQVGVGRRWANNSGDGSTAAADV